MSNKIIDEYIRAEREKGCDDQSIRIALNSAGWKDSDIARSFPVSNTVGGVVASSLDVKLRYAVTALGVGLCLQIAGLVSLMANGRITGTFLPIETSTLFLLASVFFVTAVSVIMYAFFVSARHIAFRIWVSILALCMAVFVPITVVYFAVGASSTSGEMYLFDLNIEDFLPVNFLAFLPLQVVTYLLAMITAIVHRRLALRKGWIVPSPYIWSGFLMMLIAGGLGILGLYLVLNNSRLGSW